jgi:zinc transport system ATP-binding protein
MQAEVLLLDEPASALDPGACEDLYKTLEEIHKKDGMTIIMISHDIPSALSLATHILHIGDNVFYCKADEYAGGIKK